MGLELRPISTSMIFIAGGATSPVYLAVNLLVRANKDLKLVLLWSAALLAGETAQMEVPSCQMNKGSVHTTIIEITRTAKKKGAKLSKTFI